MKQAKTAFTILFLILLGGFLFIWIQREMEFQEELADRPLPDSMHPVVAEKSRELVAAASEIGIDIVITDSFRSFDEQNSLHRQGRNTEGSIVTYAEGGESYHNYGLAIDFALKLDDGSVVWDIDLDDNDNGRSDWFEVADIGKDLGFDWGGDWNSFKDYPHLEMTFGLSIRELKKGWRPEDKLEE